jgi:hypothetical protein
LLGWIYEQYAVRRDARRFPPPITALSAETREEFLPPALAGWIQLRGSVDALRETQQPATGGN